MNELTFSAMRTVGAYYRPGQPDAAKNAFANYLRDGIIVDAIGDRIDNATERMTDRITDSIDDLSASMGGYFSDLIYEAQDTNKELNTLNKGLSCLNQRASLLVEQQKKSNQKLDEIIALLKIPDSEKVRQHAVSLGMKFFVNAKKDPDLLKDAIAEFDKALQLMPQDYFVLNKLGYIYAYNVDTLDLDKAKDCFVKSAKYAAVEDDRKAKELAADSYSRAAFVCYVQGADEEAVTNQKKALKLINSDEYHLLLSKYLVRNKKTDEAIAQLNEVILSTPELINTALGDGDFVSSKEIRTFIDQKYKHINEEIELMFDCKPEQMSKLFAAQSFIDKVNALKEEFVSK